MAARYHNLISAAALAGNCNNQDWLTLDCRFDLGDVDAGLHQWQQAHIPGATYADLEKDLSGPQTASSGRHPLPDPVDLAQRFSDWGIGHDTQVVVYDDSQGALAARAWWLLRWLGHDSVALLDGALAAWRRAGLPLTKQVRERPAQHFEMRLQADMHVDADGLAAGLADGDIVLDARAPERFLGDSEPLDERAGHIPGAHNFPYMANLDRAGLFLPAAELRLCFDAALCGRPAEHAVCMCGSGVTACHNLLAMEIAGLSGARLYAGSWSEWSRDPDRPLETGPD